MMGDLKEKTPAIFAYWDSSDHKKLANMVEHWREKFSQFLVLGDHDILPLIARYFPMYIDLYKKIRLPAAKSDVARLLALHEFGGLYVDCHVGIRDVDELRRLFTCLNDYEAIFIDRRLNYCPRPPGEHFLINSAILSRPHSELFMILARQAFANLAWQQRVEQQYGFVSYDVATLTGPILVTAVVLEPGSCTRDIRSDFNGRIMVIPEEAAPVVRNLYIDYKSPRDHWFVRQLTEPLFEPVRQPMPSSEVRFHNLFQAELRSARARIRAEIERLSSEPG
jgi:hypothetical protein